jgi:hypothetical protein
MTMTYTTQNLNRMIAAYKVKYRGKVLWDTIFENIKIFKQNQEAILADPKKCLQWHGFLQYLAEIESTIGLYGYESKGQFHRIFVNFGRAYLEEEEVQKSEKGKELNLKWISEDSKYFRVGDGKKGDIDLQDLNGLTYDVKNDYVNFEKAHGANFLLKYSSLYGTVELHKAPEDPTRGSFIETFDYCRPVADIAAARELDPLLFNKYSTEEKIRQYLGL